MTLMKAVRRTHLYAGLILAPWALMYGLSAFIFNHGGWFAEQDSRSQELKIDPAVLAFWPKPEVLADAVVARLNEPTQDQAAALGYRLLQDVSPRFQGRVTLESAQPDGSSVSLSVDPLSGRGSVLRSPAPPVPEKIRLSSNEERRLSTIEEKILAAAGDDVRDAHFSQGRFPKLFFDVERGQERRTAVYDLRSGEVTLMPMREPRELRLPNFLTSLHKSHGYPDRQPKASNFENLRTVRAMFVDAMACVLFFWGISGIAMWLQLRQLSRSGWAVFGAAITAAALVWSGMYRFFVSG